MPPSAARAASSPAAPRQQPKRARRAPERFSPEVGPLEDDYPEDQHDEGGVGDEDDASDVTSIATEEESESESESDLSGFIVADGEVEEDAGVDVEGDGVEKEWDSEDDSEDDMEDDIEEEE